MLGKEQSTFISLSFVPSLLFT